VKLLRKDRIIAFFQKNWPWWSAVLLVLLLTLPLVFAGNHVFVSDLQGDGVATPWIYDFSARELADGRWPAALSDFDFPLPRGLNAHERSLFATVPPIDAVLMAPVAWLFGWPAQWNLVIFFAMLINAGGAMAMAYVLGCRKLGLMVAGALAVTAGPIWIEALEGRANCMFPGLTLFALAAMHHGLPKGLDDPLRRRVGFSVLGGALGWLSFVIYPPGVALWVPVGVLFVGRHVLRRRLVGAKELLVPTMAIVGAYLLAIPTLSEMAESGWVMQEFSHLECAPSGRVLAFDELWKTSVGESFRGISFGFWLLAPFALIQPERRMLMGGLLALAVLGALLSLGPCPMGSRDTGLDFYGSMWSWPLIGDTAWWALSHLHYYDRLAVLTCLLLAVLSALGAEALWTRSQDKGRGVAVVFMSVVLLQVVSVHLRTLTDDQVWQEVESLETAEFLESAPEGAVVELPFDQRDQFLSILQAPGHPRVNPLRPQGVRRTHWSTRGAPDEEVWVWFDQLGRGEWANSAPERAAIAQSGIRWVFFDPQRCQKSGAWGPTAACGEAIPRQLKAVLGRGRRLGSNGVLLWELAGSF